MKITDTADMWWKNAVIYCLDIETFMDWNGDGHGDFVGLCQRIEYLAELGVTCLWLMPFYPTAGQDDGYDVTDHYGVDQRLGNHGGFVELIRTANDRGIRVIVDLVVNHTSDQHPWFIEARKSIDNPYRDFYVWRRDAPPDTSDEIIFPDQEDSIWELDEQTGEYYLHRFYTHQPDLNITNPLVQDEIAKALGFWLQLGVAGFRIDAVPYFLETLGTTADDSTEFGDPHDYLRRLRTFANRRSGGVMLLGEVNLHYPDARKYFGDGHGDQLTMLFDFIANQALFLSVVRQSAGPLLKALAERPPIPDDCQWAMFVRNHDELTLDKLSEAERQEIFAALGPDKEMQIFDRGLRRRLPPMLEGDQQRIRMMYALTFALPGTPTLLYGEEIGMGENLAVPGRLAVRTPMQWSDGDNAGFSLAASNKLSRPVTTGEFGAKNVNVAAQHRDRDSLLEFFTLLISRYRACPELGWAPLQVLHQPHDAVIALCSQADDATVVTVHNLSDKPLSVPLTLDSATSEHRLVDLLEDGFAAVDAQGRTRIEMERYGYRWLRLVGPDNRRLV